jgi:uncharacterized protein YjiS (DUF1127 family)
MPHQNNAESFSTHPKRTIKMAAFDTSRTSYGAHANSAKIGGFFSNAVASVVAWNDARVTRNALTSLTDRELTDIGLSRGDINAVLDRKITR